MAEGPFDFDSHPDPRYMMSLLRERLADTAGAERRCRLYLCGLVHLQVPWLSGVTRKPDVLTKLQRACRLAELVADGLRELGDVPPYMLTVSGDPTGPSWYRCLRADHWEGMRTRVEPAPSQETQADLLRQVFGGAWHGPSRGWEFRPEWLTPDVTALAEAAYGVRLNDQECRHCDGKGCLLGSGPDRGNPECEQCWGQGRLDEGLLDPARVGILADAVEEAGGRGRLLECLRAGHPFIRGNWAVDALRGVW